MNNDEKNDEKPENIRNGYNAIRVVPPFVADLISAAETAGAWRTGIESDKRQRGSSINCDIYGYDEKSALAVVQVRECRFHPRRYNQVRKNYFLIGRTETGAVFAHPCESPARSKRALTSPESAVLWVLSRIWECREEDLVDIERQGDVAFVPVRSIPPDAALVPDGEAIVIRDTHRLTGKIYRTPSGTIYCSRGAKLEHTKRQHRTIKARAGLYRVQPGLRAAGWGFSVPKGD